MMIKRSITIKAVTFFLLLSLPILAIIHYYSFTMSREIIVKLTKENATALGGEVVNLVESRIKPVENVLRNIALTLENPNLSDIAISKLTREIVENNSSIYGVAIAFEPYEMFMDQLFFAPYSHRTSGNEPRVKTTTLGSSNYRYFNMDWYLLPKLKGQPVWTDPYFDSGGGNVMMTTYAVPFYREYGPHKKRKFAGVITADISLSWLQHYLEKVKLYDSGYACLLSENGLFIYHPVSSLVLNDTIFSLAEKLDDPELWEIGRDIVQGKTNIWERENYQNGARSFFYYRPLSVAGWSLCFLFPRDEVVQDITTLTKKTFTISLLGFLVLAIGITILTRRFTKPLVNLSRAAQQISGGDLNSTIPTINSEDELGDLTRSFSDMQASLNDHIKQLTDTTAQKERIESELRIARNIQMSILPKLTPPFPICKEIDIYAMIRPAREIGGDLYDFFFIDDHHFCFIIGDVSDKGVPAAFFMAVTKTLLKVVVEQTPDPGTILSKVNSDLSDGNDSCMFVTLFIAILDLKTGKVVTGNGGHNPPVILNKKGINFLPTPLEPLVGALPGVEYTTDEFFMEPGDTLYLYTDGVTEAMNTKRELYQEERMLKELQKNGQCSVEEIIKAIDESVIEFSDGAEQSDDITMLALRYNG